MISYKVFSISNVRYITTAILESIIKYYIMLLQFAQAKKHHINFI